jgi:hypothetical protein
MATPPNTLPLVRVSGSPGEIGVALGQAGREAVHAHLLRSEFWREMTSPAHAARVARMADGVRARFPWIGEEIEGLAEGLELPADQVMAWNCRGDLLASAPDGCTTVMVPGAEPVIAHNEDGLPFFRGACFRAEVRPDDAPAFTAFCYPGSIPGHTFAVTEAGLVQAVNNIRLAGAEPVIPRMVLGRAVLGAGSSEAAVAILRAGAGSGGFHFALCDRRNRRILSVEFGRGVTSVVEVSAPSVHANHALHLPGRDDQIVTRSSADRQARGEALLETGAGPLAILRDGAGPGLPIRRDAPDDPDEENTLGTAVFRLSEAGVRWEVFAGVDPEPAHSGRVT